MELPHQVPGGRVADVPDAETGEQTPGLVLFRGLDTGEQIVRSLLSADRAFLDQFIAVFCQSIDVRVAFEIALFDERFDLFRAESGDVHAGPGGEVRDGPGQLCGAAGVHAADVCRSLFPDERFAADRAVVRSLVDDLRFGDTVHQLRDDVSGLEDVVDAADADLLLPDVVLVVQSDVGDVCAAEARRFSGLGVHDPPDESDLAGPSDRGRDVLHEHRSLFRRIFVGNVPRRVLGTGREFVAQSGLVDLDDSAVEVEIDLSAHVSDRPDGGDDLIGSIAMSVVYHRQAERLQRIHTETMAAGQVFRTFLDIEDEHPKAAFFRDRGVELTERAGGEVPRVRGGLLPQFLLELVIAFEVLMAHVDFAAKGQALIGQVQRQRDVRDDARVGRDVFPDETVAAGLGENEFHRAVALSAIGDGHGQAVHLDFHGERGVRMDCMDFVHERTDVVEFEDVLDGEHGHGMGHLDAGLPLDSAAHFLGRRVRVDPLRVLLLRRFQLLHELVVLKVRDLRSVLVVIPVHVVFDLIP